MAYSILYPNCSVFLHLARIMIRIDVISSFAFVPARYGGLIGQVGLVDSVEVFDMIRMSNRRLWLELVCYFQG